MNHLTDWMLKEMKELHCITTAMMIDSLSLHPSHSQTVVRQLKTTVYKNRNRQKQNI